MNRLWLVATAALTLTIAQQFIATGAYAQEADPAAAEWCASHYGTIVERYPASNASSETPVALGSSIRFCEFAGGEGADPSDSRISIRLTTLASDQPSIAATAYFTSPEMAERRDSHNLPTRHRR